MTLHAHAHAHDEGKRASRIHDNELKQLTPTTEKWSLHRLPITDPWIKTTQFYQLFKVTLKRSKLI